jgi:hypothetical protein
MSLTQAIESSHDFSYYTEQELQRWNDRLDFSPSEIQKRYLRNDLEVAIKIVLDVGGDGRSFLIGVSRESGRKFDSHCAGAQDKLFVLIDDVHVVDDKDRSIQGVRSIVGLRALIRSRTLESVIPFTCRA